MSKDEIPLNTSPENAHEPWIVCPGHGLQVDRDCIYRENWASHFTWVWQGLRISASVFCSHRIPHKQGSWCWAWSIALCEPFSSVGRLAWKGGLEKAFADRQLRLSPGCSLLTHFIGSYRYFPGRGLQYTGDGYYSQELAKASSFKSSGGGSHHDGSGSDYVERTTA